MAGLRKLLIAALSFAGVLAIYLLYTRISKTPEIDVDTGTGLIIADGNVAALDGEIGKIAGVGVTTLKKTEFVHRNKNKEVDREFGFEVLLHEEKDLWEIEKPYLNIFQPNFKCFVTADKGKVDVETAVGKPTPKDATFAGNVVIHIVPEGSSSIKESFIYLDDVAFLSEKTQFSTAGPVQFVSEDAQMLGVGLELVYNDQLQRLEFLRITDLKSLHIKSPQMTLRSDAASNVPAQAEQNQTPASQGSLVSPAANQKKTEPNEGDYYKCLCSKNVVIDTSQPGQMPWRIIAEEQIAINNIFWSRPANTKSDEVKIADANDSVSEKSPPAKPGEPNKPPQQLMDITLTCDGGVVIAPMDSPLPQLSSSQVRSKPGTSDSKALRNSDDIPGRTKFVTKRIDYDAPTGQAIARGQTELTFYTSNTTGAVKTAVPVKITAQKETRFLPELNQVVFDGNCLCVMPPQDPNKQFDYTLSAPTLTVNFLKDNAGKTAAFSDVIASGPVTLNFYVDDFAGAAGQNNALPARLTARKQAKFSTASNQITFEDDCLCVVSRQDPNFLERYILSAQTLTVDLPKDVNDRSYNASAGIEHLAAIGGVVRLATIRTAGKELLGGIELKCRRFDYDAPQELCLVSGPGVIKVDNSRFPEPKPDQAGFSLRRSCFAFLQNFDTLKYFAKSNRLVADAQSQGTLRVDYIPIIKGKYGRQIVATANRIEADLVSAEGGQTELLTLTALDGITFEDDKNQFAGSNFFYDHAKSLMKVRGDRLQPCYLNGALVDGIEYNLKTGKAKAQVVGPGTLQIK